MKYKSKRGTTINIPDGLSKKQIAAIKADADAGYGTRAQETANRLAKVGAPQSKSIDDRIARTQAEIDKRKKAGQAETPGLTKRLNDLKSGQGDPAGVDPAAGRTDSNPGTKFDRGSVDAFLDGILDNFKPLDLSGAPKVLSAGELEAERQQNQDALYREETKYLERDRLRELEQKKQELAERGIPYRPDAEGDPNTRDLYGRTIGNINRGYQAQDQSALDRARSGADARMATQAGVNKTAYDAFVNTAVEGYQSQLDAANTGNTLLNTLINEYGLTREEALAKMKIKSDERIAKIMARAKGGSSGSPSSDQADTGGFEIVG